MRYCKILVRWNLRNVPKSKPDVVSFVPIYVRTYTSSPRTYDAWATAVSIVYIIYIFGKVIQLYCIRAAEKHGNRKTFESAKTASCHVVGVRVVCARGTLRSRRGYTRLCVRVCTRKTKNYDYQRSLGREVGCRYERIEH